MRHLVCVEFGVALGTALGGVLGVALGVVVGNKTAMHRAGFGAILTP